MKEGIKQWTFFSSLWDSLLTEVAVVTKTFLQFMKIVLHLSIAQVCGFLPLV